MGDLIDRKAAINALNDEITITGENNAYVVRDYVRRVKRKLENLPSEEPEIIYCAGCKYMYTEETGFWCAQAGKEVHLDHYCGYAERREVGNGPS